MSLADPSAESISEIPSHAARGPGTLVEFRPDLAKVATVKDDEDDPEDSDVE